MCEIGNSDGNTLEDKIMSVTRWMLAIALALAVSGGEPVLSAQQGQVGTGLGLYGLGPRLGENVELALELRGELGLSAEQVGSLQTLLAGISQDVDPLAGEITELRAMVMAGEVDRVESLVQLQGLLAQYRTVAAPYQTGVETILTAAQHETLRALMWETRPIPSSGLGVVGSGFAWNSRLGSGRGVGMAQVGSLGARAALGFGGGGGRGWGRGVGRGVGRGWGLRRWR